MVRLLYIIFSIILIVLGIFSLRLALNFSSQVDYGKFQHNPYATGSYAGSGVDSAADGGACGFAILSGLCFLSAAIIEVNRNKIGRRR